MTSSVDRPLVLLDLADLLGRYRFVELSLFALVGTRVAAIADPAVCVYLAGASRAHGFRAELIEGRLPVSVGLPSLATCTRSPGPVVDRLLSELATTEERSLLALLIGGWYPAMLTAYLDHLDRASGPADGPIMRMLRRLTADLQACSDEGAALARDLGWPLAAPLCSSSLVTGGGPFGTLGT